MGQKLHSTKPYCTSSVRSVKALSLQLRQTYTGSPSFFVTATRSIHPRRLGRSFSSPWKVNSPLACLASFRMAETAQLSCHYRMSPCNCVLHVPVVYLPNIYLCYYLQAQLTCHNKFCKKFFVHVRTLCTRHSLRFFECLGTRLKHWTWEAKNLRPKTWDPCTQSFRAVLHSTAQYLLNFLIRRRYLPACRIASFIV